MPAVHESVVTETIRTIEQSGPLDDASAMREALGASSPDERIARRASALGHRIGIESDLQRAGHFAPWIGFGLMLLVALAGLALAGSVTGNAERRINMLAALFSLLGFHTFTMCAWLAGLLLPSRLRSRPRASFGWIWMALTARLAGGRSGRLPVLLQSALQLLVQARLLHWTLGLASHAIWTVSFAVVLASVLFALAFHRYTLGWETTILEADFFVRTVRVLGWLPAHAGFPLPDTAAILSPGNSTLEAPDTQRTLAWWLTGCIAVYGLIPRMLALAVCCAVWSSRRSALRPDLSLPYYRRLLARLDAMAPKDIVDPDAGAAYGSAPFGTAVHVADGPFSDTLLIAAYEMPPGAAWPPAGLAELLEPLRPAPTLLDIDGSADSRRRLLDVASRLRPRRLLLACRAVSSPDRGTERLLRELLAHCEIGGLWLVGDADASGDREGRSRWRRWLAETGLGSVAAHDDPRAALENVPA